MLRKHFGLEFAKIVCTIYILVNSYQLLYLTLTQFEKKAFCLLCPVNLNQHCISNLTSQKKFGSASGAKIYTNIEEKPCAKIAIGRTTKMFKNGFFFQNKIAGRRMLSQFLSFCCFGNARVLN